MLDVLRRITQEVDAARDLNIALDIIVDRVQSAMGTEVCSVYLLDDESKQYVFMATRGLNTEMVGKVTLELDEGLVGLVGERAEPVNLHNASRHPRYHYVGELGEEKYESFLGVPVIHHRKVLGVIVVQQTGRRRFDESEEAFLITLSAQLAGIIVHAQATGAFTISGVAADLPASRFPGTAGAPGVAIGTSIVIYPEADLYQVPERTTKKIKSEKKIFRNAVKEVRAEIRKLGSRLSDRLQPEELTLFDAYQRMLDETAITGEVIERIDQGVWSQTALRQVIEAHVASFEALDDHYMRERGSDVLDLGQRILTKLQSKEERKRTYPRGTVLIGDDLTPGMLAEVPRSKLAGLVSVSGSGSSHVAILAKAMGVPTVMGVEDLPLHLLEEKPIIVDGFDGVVITYPNKDQLALYKRIVKEEAAFVEGLEPLKDERCETKDGHRVLLWVNTGLMTDVARSLDRGAEGVGLYRTEVHFMMNDRFPTEEEQRLIYRKHLKAFSPRQVTMRTLDIGGDKALSYFPIQEENPFLGWRGIRVTLDHPEIFLAQVRAMIKATEGVDAYLRIMLPMVSSIAEVDEAQRLISQCYREIVEEGVEVEMPDVGVMIEVPAAVYQARDIVKRVDFLSVGSNDLIQYMLAVDRNNSRVAELYQDFHPAVLQALKQVVDAAHSERKPVGICGEMAGNPSAAILLTAMGYDVLSMNSTNLLMVKWVIRSFEMTRAKKMLNKVLKMDNAFLIKSYVEDEMRKAGLGQLIHSRPVAVV
ncbi:MAG TPA: phosphoenolpyruvate--protein phosphotransferase [Pseudomonadales bacterium]|jgi:phosphotransferase system enzyme I (PtsP)|nr:phosphoenolpyruvate--protein phosphotransferase [Pseudomonadales bacterium]MDP6315163.1 phosphoenolpyruvate--protein phosphotransferase [Pseudomonadales bacterium]MDP7314418.1 phosphoenolpyruvate--protein phosphotransferase [Pseudomonadales bacterium]HJP50419.1 phosphoenolpyruvate--protein phosphotransferase [Pseudomonadales bacterium]|tara:strand:- start:3025 stop:5304 length:2280 start_codon:yes stop_codon:yes gene_type:complete